MKPLLLLLLLSLCGYITAHGHQDQVPVSPITQIRAGQDQKEALKINEAIFQAIGFGNTFMVTTPAGNVIIDTSIAFNSARHKKLLEAVSAGPVKYIILTHAHGDHTGGVGAWKQPGTQIIAQKNHVEFAHYMARLNGFYGVRNAAQFGNAVATRRASPAWPGNYGAVIEPAILFDDKYEFELGGL
ncbi:MAG: MBL fold metallo-hydrolase, partial [Blastocatellia bacterium]